MSAKYQILSGPVRIFCSWD